MEEVAEGGEAFPNSASVGGAGQIPSLNSILEIIVLTFFFENLFFLTVGANHIDS